jgi:hypothetical protein
MHGKISSLSDELEMVGKIPAKQPLKNRLSVGFIINFGLSPIKMGQIF